MADNALSEEQRTHLKDLTSNHVYCYQHFDLTVREFVNELFNECIDKFLNLIPTLRSSLVEAMTKHKTAEETAVISAQMDSSLAKYTMEFYARLEVKADALEMYLDNHIIRIPPEKILHQDKAHHLYEELITILNNECSLGGDKGDQYTQENTASILSEKLDAERIELLKKRSHKMKLKAELELAEQTLKRLEKFENCTDSILSNFDGSVKEFVLKNVAAVKDLPKSDNI